MKRLTDEQVNYISNQVDKSLITSDLLKEDMIDHFCCLIEDEINKGISFEVSCENTFKTIFPDGLTKEYKRNIFLLTSKNIKIARFVIFLLTFLTTAFIFTSFLLKTLNWNYSKDLFTIAALIFVLILVPLYLLFYFRKTFSRVDSKKSRYTIGIIGITFFLAGLTFKYFHLPGAYYLLLIGTAILNFIFLPSLFYMLYRYESDKNKTRIVVRKLFYLFSFLSLVFFLLTIFLKILHLPGSGVSLIITGIIFILGFLPLLFYRLYNSDYKL